MNVGILRATSFGQVVLFVLFLLSSSNPAVLADDISLQYLGSGKPWQTEIFIKDSGQKGPTVVVIGGVPE